MTTQSSNSASRVDEQQGPRRVVIEDAPLVEDRDDEEIFRIRQRRMPEGEGAPLAVKKWERFALAIVVVLGSGGAMWALALIAGPIGAAFGAGVLALYFLLGGMPALIASAHRVREDREILDEIRHEHETRDARNASTRRAGSTASRSA